jgi:hypothetical protein
VTVSLNGDQWACATIQTSENSLVFPIIRVDNWATKSKEFYSNSDNALLYTLAALFLAISVIGVLAVMVSIAEGLFSRETFHIQQFVVVLFTFAFNLSTQFFNRL